MDDLIADMMDSLADDILFIVAFPLVVFLIFICHELGHFMTARLSGVRVANCSVGFGRELWGATDKHGTRWSVRMIPLCGFVQLEGREKKDDASFSAKPLWQRFVIVAAGPLANVALAFLFLFSFFAVAGQPSTPPFITGVEVGGPAAQAGIAVGDKMLAVEGQPVVRYEEVQDVTEARPGKPVRLRIERDGRPLELEVVPEQAQYIDVNGFEREHGRIGVLALHKPLKLNAITSIDNIPTYENEEYVRALLWDRMGQSARLGIKAVDGTSHYYRVYLDPEMNAQLMNPGSDDYERVFLGRLRNNVYIDFGLAGAAAFSAQETGRLIAGLFGVLGQVWPIDKLMVKPEVVVARHTAPFVYDMYSIFYIAAFMSLCVALFNLLPVPRLDGGMIVLLLAEAVLGPARSREAGPYVLRGSLLLFVALVTLANMDTLMALGS